MSLYDDASLILYPSGYKEDKIYSLKPTDGSGDLTFTRASTATRVNAEGLIETSPVNLLQQSETIGISPWSNSNVTITANSVIAPNGTTTADVLTETTATTSQFRTQQPSPQSTNIYTLSVYVKNITGTRQAYIDLGPVTGFFNFATETTYSASAIPSFEKLADGWYRFSLTTATAITPTTIYMGLGQSDSETYTGNGTSAIAFWGAQVNIGSTAKPYFPTTDRLDVPRIDYTGGGCGKLLLEPQRTNLVTYSEQFDNAGWAGSAIVTANTVVSPDGTQNADSIMESGATDYHIVGNPTPSSTSGTSYVFSFFAKPNGRNFTRVLFGNGAWQDNQSAYFNLLTGAVVVSASVTASMVDCGNGWYRCIAICTADASTTAIAYFGPARNMTDGYNVYGGTASLGIYAWGAQLEAGSYVSSYIPTSGTAVTRLADEASKTGISSLINSTEGVLYAEIAALYYGGNNRAIAISDGTSSNRVLVYYTTTTNQITALYTYSGTTQVSINETLTDSTQFIKFAFKYKENDCAFWINGIKVGTDNTATAFAADTLDTLRFDSGAGSSDFYGKVQNLMVFPSALSDTELLALTTL
jgi:hypothetical protein